MNFIIVTGVSGAGKSRAVVALEDMGYYCIDNMPPVLLSKFIELCHGSPLDKVAIVMDVRGGDFFKGFNDSLKELENSSSTYKMLFLEANTDTLVNRYKETRRKHPLLDETNGSIEKAVTKELKMLKELRSQADYIIDTSYLSPAQLKERINSLFLDNPDHILNVLCVSFGFKFGPLQEADLMFDVRCLPNPYYLPELRHQTGLDKPVYDYVFSNEAATTLLTKMLDLIDYLIPLYKAEGKSQLVIGIGCTGGKHRSVAFSEAIANHLKENNLLCSTNHRDITKRI